MNKLLLLSMLLGLSAHAADTCLDNGKIRYRKFGKMTEENASYCFDKSTGSLSSQSCKKGNCEAVNAIGKKSDKEVAATANSAFGTPGFHMCRALGGEPQIMEYFDGKDWNQADRCSFKNDGSFVNTSRLLQKK